MIRDDNPQNYRNFEASHRQATDSQGQQQANQNHRQRRPPRQQPNQGYQQQQPTAGFQWQPVSQDYQRWQTADQDGNQTEVEEVVMVGMKPVMTGFGMGTGTGVSDLLPRIFSLMKDHRFVAGLIIGAVLCLFAMDASLSSMRNHNANLESENKMLTEQVETLRHEMGTSDGQDDGL